MKNFLLRSPWALPVFASLTFFFPAAHSGVILIDQIKHFELASGELNEYLRQEFSTKDEVRSQETLQLHFLLTQMSEMERSLTALKRVLPIHPCRLHVPCELPKLLEIPDENEVTFFEKSYAIWIDDQTPEFIQYILKIKSVIRSDYYQSVLDQAVKKKFKNAISQLRERRSSKQINQVPCHQDLVFVKELMKSKAPRKTRGKKRSNPTPSAPDDLASGSPEMVTNGIKTPSDVSRKDLIDQIWRERSLPYQLHLARSGKARGDHLGSLKFSEEKHKLIKKSLFRSDTDLDLELSDRDIENDTRRTHLLGKLAKLKTETGDAKSETSLEDLAMIYCYFSDDSLAELIEVLEEEIAAKTVETSQNSSAQVEDICAQGKEGHSEISHHPDTSDCLSKPPALFRKWRFKFGQRLPDSKIKED